LSFLHTFCNALMFMIPYVLVTYMFNSMSNWMYFFMYSLFCFILSSTCFWCYLHPSSGAQLQRSALGVCVVLVC
jgi:hypothetical protein